MGFYKLNRTYPDVVSYYIASAQFTWAKIINRALKITCLCIKQKWIKDIAKCFDFFATFIIWSTSVSALQIIATPHVIYSDY